MVPKFENFLVPYLRLLSDEKPHTQKKLTEYNATALNLSDADRVERTKKGSFTKLYDRTQWSGTYLRKALLTAAIGRGKYAITKRGLELLATNPAYLDRKQLSKYPEFVEFIHKKKADGSDSEPDVIENSEVTPFELMEASSKELRDELVADLLDKIKSQSPQFFERLVIKLLVAMGYGGSFEDAAYVTKYSHDEGIDGYQLANYMIDYNIGVSIRQTFEVKRIDSTFLQKNEQYTKL